MMNSDSLLSKIESQVKIEFERTNRILTFEEYMQLVLTEPKTHVRGSAEYLVAMMDHFGQAETKSGGSHFKVFDMSFGEDGDNRHRVIGQNDVQQAIYRTLQNFVKEGINNKLILLHGPNGSAKSSLVNCMVRGMEKY